MTSSLTYFPVTACRMMGIKPPRLAEQAPHPAVIDALRDIQAALPLQRMLVYAPDAVGRHLLDRFPQASEQLRHSAPVAAEVSSVVPAKTPVCFTSMLTGAAPQVHGIRQYQRPVVKHDTLFDALLRSGRRVALVAVRDSSFDLMFAGREMDYFSEDYDTGVTQRTLELIAAGNHDFILAYHQEYDDALHRTQPFSDECIAAFERHVASFTKLAAAAKKSWAGTSHVVAFTPDHGAHLRPETGRGDHGLDIPEDMELLHFWGLRY